MHICRRKLHLNTFSATLNPKRNLYMSAPVSKREKQGERKKRKRARSAHLPKVAMLPLCMGITLGAVPQSGLRNSTSEDTLV